MNHIIERLVERTPYTTISSEGRLFTQQDVVVFAESLIKECFTAIKNDDGYHLSVSTIDDRYKQGVQMGLEFAITDISEYFGVKE